MHNIHHLGITVRNLERMIEFYKEAFGFEVLGEERRYIDDKGQLSTRIAMMRSGNCFLEIIFQASLTHTAASTAASHGYAHFCLEVSDIDQDYERLRALGVDFAQPPPVEFDETRSVKGRDPEGNMFELLQTMRPWECEFDDLPAIGRR
jgi:glyoxylase I family protein